MSLFWVFLTVVCLEVYWGIREKNKFSCEVKMLCSKYWRLLVIVAAPFLILLVFYLITGTLDDFYSWAYLLNREVYPKYTGGYGASPIQGFFGGITNLFGIIESGESWFNLVVYLICAFGLFFFMVNLSGWTFKFGERINSYNCHTALLESEKGEVYILPTYMVTDDGNYLMIMGLTVFIAAKAIVSNEKSLPLLGRTTACMCILTLLNEAASG